MLERTYQQFQPCWLALACISFLVFSPAARSQEGEEEELEEEFELIEQSGEVVVSASKHEQKIGQSPSAVVVITRREIEESGAVTLMELLRRWPVTHVYESDPIYPAIDVRNNYRVVLLIDGREANHEFFVSAFYAMLPVELPEIERIEVVLGPNSALYGANAVSAVVNIITRKPKAEPGAEAVFAAGEHGEVDLDLQAYTGAGPLALRLSGGLSRSNAWMDNNHPAKDIWRANALALLDVGEGELKLDSGFSCSSGDFFGTLADIYIEDIWAAHADASFKYGDLQLRSYWYASRGQVTLALDLYYPPLGVELGYVPPLDLSGDTWHNEAQFNLEPWPGNLLILGADARYTRYHSPQLVKDDVWEMRAGAHFHDEQKLGEQWLLEVGLRYDWNNRTDWALCPRGAIIFNPVAEHYFRLSGGMAFRKPSIMETAMNFEVEPNPAFPEIEDLFEKHGIANPDLKNELLSSIELGWRGSWLEGRLKTSIDAYAAFNRHIVDFFTNVVFEDSPLGPRLNLDKSQIGYEDLQGDTDTFGAHLNFEGRPWDWLSFFLRTDVAFSFLSEQDYRERHASPRFIFAVGANFEAPLGIRGQLTLAGRETYYEDRRNAESIFLPSPPYRMPAMCYVIAYLGRTFALGPLDLEGGLYFFNVFNSRFREVAGTIDSRAENFGGELLGRRVTVVLRARY